MQHFNVNNLFAQIKQTASQRLNHSVIKQKTNTGHISPCLIDIYYPRCFFYPQDIPLEDLQFY